MAGEPIQLRIVGEGGKCRRTAPIERLIPEALEWVAKGYTVSLTPKSIPHQKAEVRAKPDDEYATLVEPPVTGGDLSWLMAARNLIQATPLRRSSTT